MVCPSVSTIVTNNPAPRPASSEECEDIRYKRAIDGAGEPMQVGSGQVS